MPDPAITHTLRTVTSDVERLLDARLRPLNLTVPQLGFLAFFVATPDSCSADAARANHVTPQTGTSIMQGLTRRGLITSAMIPGEGRRMVATVTADGRRTHTKALRAVRDVEDRLAELLADVGVKALRAVADALAAEPKPVKAKKPKKAVAKKAVKKLAKKVAKKTTKRAAKKTAKPRRPAAERVAPKADVVWGD